MKKEILITNDDGFDAAGLRALIEALQDIAHLTIVALTTCSNLSLSIFSKSL